ncbi:MAG: RHS repeat protein [Alphaproteobacteria bacterium]|nr:RHS repeat protein [Alphaproteobacteria bacterium]
MTRAYNRRGEVTRETRTSGAAVLTTTYTYDRAGRIAAIGYPSGLAASYTRDTMGRITSVGAANPLFAGNDLLGLGRSVWRAHAIAHALLGQYVTRLFRISLDLVPQRTNIDA